jgi:hypothetical protein
MMAHGIRAVATSHPGVFPLLLSRPARTGEALGVRDSVYAALRAAGQEPAQIERTERLISTAILGFAVSEAAGRFARHSQASATRISPACWTGCATSSTVTADGDRPS